MVATYISASVLNIGYLDLVSGPIYMLRVKHMLKS